MQFGQLKRRHFVTLLGGAAAWPFAARARDAKKIPRIGFLGLAPEFSGAEAMRAGLRDLGYVEGRSIVIEWRWAEKVDQLPELAAELVRMNVDVIVAPSSTFVEAARQATTTIPIVFAVHADPVGLGHVASLARPGGTVDAPYGACHQGTGNDEGGRTASAADRHPLESHYAVPPDRLEGDRGGRRKARSPAPHGARANARGVRQRVFDDDPRNGKQFSRRRFTPHCCPPRASGGARDEVSAAWHVPPDGECGRKRPHELRRRPRQPLSARCSLYRPDSQRRQTSRPAGGAGVQIPARHQSRNCQGARSRNPANAARPRRRGDRIECRVISDSGTTQTRRARRGTSVHWAEAVKATPRSK